MRFHGVMFSNFLNLNYLTVVILKLLMFSSLMIFISDQKAVHNSYMPQFLFHCVQFLAVTIATCGRLFFIFGGKNVKLQTFYRFSA
jgi:hypothetical protein